MLSSYEHLLPPSPSRSLGAQLTDLNDAKARQAITKLGKPVKLSKDKVEFLNNTLNNNPLFLKNIDAKYLPSVSHNAALAATKAARAHRDRLLSDLIPSKEADVARQANRLQAIAVMVHSQLKAEGYLSAAELAAGPEAFANKLVAAVQAGGATGDHLAAVRKAMANIDALEMHFKTQTISDRFLPMWGQNKLELNNAIDSLASANEDFHTAKNDYETTIKDIKLYQTMGHLTRGRFLRYMCAVVPKVIRNNSMNALNMVGMATMLFYLPDMYESVKQRFGSNSNQSGGGGGDQGGAT